MCTFKVLTIGKIDELDQCFVDENMLGKGIYLTTTPTLHMEGVTLEKLIEIRGYVYQLDIEKDEWCNNIRECQLTEVKLKLV